MDRYPNTTQGVADMLRDTCAIPATVVDATSDPAVQGVWRFTLSNGVAGVAYLAGYLDPWGCTREINDFEIEESV